MRQRPDRDCRDAQNETVVDGDFVRIAAEGHLMRRAADFVLVAVSAGEAVFAILLQTFIA